MGKLRILLSLAYVLFTASCYAETKTVRKIDFSHMPTGVIKATSFNIRTGTAKDGPNHWNLRKGLVFDTLVLTKADVVGMQEVKDFQLSEIQAALPQYGAYSVQSVKKGDPGREACSVLYRKDRFKLADSGTFWFSDTPDKPASSGWGNKFVRICSWVHLVEKDGGKGFYVYNVHLDHQSQPSREKSVRLLVKEIADRKTDDPFLVMGDFNMPPDNPAMAYLLKKGVESPYPALVTAWELANPDKPSGGTAHRFNGNANGKKIDHILVTDGAKVLGADIDRHSVNGRYPSDHFPISAIIRLHELNNDCVFNDD